MRLTRTRNRHPNGFTLIETLVATVITALGVLGILGLQMRTLADNQSGVRRAQAIRLIEDLSERTHANPNSPDRSAATFPTGITPPNPSPTAVPPHAARTQWPATTSHDGRHPFANCCQAGPPRSSSQETRQPPAPAMGASWGS